MKEAVAKILEKEGYVGEVAKHKKGEPLVVTLSYKNNAPVISGFKRISKPSRRMYLGVRDIHTVKRGKGLLVLSTPAGILSGNDARQARVGGEALFEIW
jgi:small subunit ribosomal protein S8